MPVASGTHPYSPRAGAVALAVLVLVLRRRRRGGGVTSSSRSRGVGVTRRRSRRGVLLLSCWCWCWWRCRYCCSYSRVSSPLLLVLPLVPLALLELCFFVGDYQHRSFFSTQQSLVFKNKEQQSYFQLLLNVFLVLVFDYLNRRFLEQHDIYNDWFYL